METTVVAATLPFSTYESFPKNLLLHALQDWTGYSCSYGRKHGGLNVYQLNNRLFRCACCAWCLVLSAARRIKNLSRSSPIFMLKISPVLIQDDLATDAVSIVDQSASHKNILQWMPSLKSTLRLLCDQFLVKELFAPYLMGKKRRANSFVSIDCKWVCIVCLHIE